MEITFDRRFRGPLTSANGGYACGRLAEFVDAEAVEVTLRLPPPLDRPLVVRGDGEWATLLDGEDVVAEARPAQLELEVPARVPIAAAVEARSRHVRAVPAEFAECFTCGIRNETDGLGVYAGAVAGREPLHAAPVTFRDESPEIVWAAIDCPGAYATGAVGRGDVVLGRMTARVHRLPEIGETCVVTAWPLEENGRKLFAGTALFGEDGELLAFSRQVWIVPRS
ncbi:MAG TPA: hypothetical protein VJ745_03835 [Gaiellaceae bacterium]|nr:hypothetical protein [Gaiellaceae bacterium]